MPRIWTEAACALLMVALLSGCATRKEKLLPHGDSTMLDIWDRETGDGGGGAITTAGPQNPAGAGRAARQLLDARQSLRRPLSAADRKAAPALNASYTRTAASEIDRQFHRLPNPDLVMYVFPHLSGTDPAPIPGYTTVFPLYRRVQYAMPGERTEDY